MAIIGHRWVGTAAAWIAAAVLMAGCTAGPAAQPHDHTPAPVACTGPAELDLDCQLNRYHELTRTAGPKAAFADLRVAYERSGFVRGNCHELVHKIGHAAGELYGTVEEAYRNADESCAGGYFHGATEAVMVAAAATGSELTACDGIRSGEQYSVRHLWCAHGMGHGFMALNDDNFGPALVGCDGLPDPWEREHCYGGVFMENVSAALADPEQSSMRPVEPLYPCTAVEPRHKGKCYEKQTGYALYLADGDFIAVFAQCASTPDVGYRAACASGVGDRAVVRSTRLVRGDPHVGRTIAALCVQGGSAAADCVTGAIRTVVRHGHGESLADALCASFDRPELTAACNTGRAAAIREYRPE